MFKDSFWGLNGFEELRKYIKQGNEFCKEVSSIMQERAELEITYSKTLSKLSHRLNKSAGSCIGTLSSAWSLVASEMDNEAEVHRMFGQSLIDDLYKPLKNLAEAQQKTRKPIESTVDSSVKNYTARKTEEAKSKKNSWSAAKDREKVCDQLANARAGKGKLTSEKDIQKLEKKTRSEEERMKKADREYHENCQKFESARQEWQTTVLKGSSQLQALEENRISNMQDILSKYSAHLSVIGPKLTQCCDHLGEAALSINVQADVRTVIDQKGTGPYQSEQLLPDYFAEDLTNQMDRERRRQCLQNYILYLQADIERDIKGKEGVEKLIEVYTNRPNFADAESQEDAKLRYAHVSAMLSYLEASQSKIAGSMGKLDGRTVPSSKYTQYIERNKEKSGMTTSILRLPASMTTDSFSDAGASYRPPADGGQVDNFVGVHLQNMYSYDDDEFDVYDSVSPTTIGQCRALYDYNASQNDELTIRPGEVINIHEKLGDGWWQGELNGRVGIFPESYVEEITGNNYSWA